jgi:hypothetical protein
MITRDYNGGILAEFNDQIASGGYTLTKSILWKLLTLIWKHRHTCTARVQLSPGLMIT